MEELGFLTTPGTTRPSTERLIPEDPKPHHRRENFICDFLTKLVYVLTGLEIYLLIVQLTKSTD